MVEADLLSAGGGAPSGAKVLYTGLPNEHDLEFIASLVQAVHALVIVVDHTGEIVWFNQACEQASGFLAAEVKGKKLWDMLLPDEDASLSIRRLDAIVSGAPVEKRVARWKTRSGEIRYISFSTGVMHDRHGAVRYLIATGIDVTETRNAEDALRQVNSVLEGRVEERTSDIRSMIVQLEHANQLQKRFIADASHELRTPLTIIQAELDLLAAQNALDTGTRDALDRISGESRRLANLANDLLLLAKGDANQFGSGREARVDEILLDCISQLRTLAANKKITWRIDADEPVEVHCNVPSISRALTNLMENAIKYSPEGALVKLSLARLDEHVVIEISDSGPGIPAGDLPRIFDRFYRSDLARSAGGSGLGLSIVKAIVEAHGGTVSIESKLGAGTTARVELPVGAIPTQADTSAPA